MASDNYWRRAQYVDHYDGDTITLIIDLGFRQFTEDRFRLLGVDTPEMRGDEREDGIKAKAFVDLWIIEAQAKAFDDEWPLTIRSEKTGKYGRWLADIYDDEGCNLADDLLEAGHAVIYGESWPPQPPPP